MARASGNNNTKNNEHDDQKCIQFTILNIFLNIFGLKCNGRHASLLKNKFMLIRVITLSALFGSLTIFVLHNKIIYVNALVNLSISVTDTIQNIYDLFQYIIDLVYVYKYGRGVCEEYKTQYFIVDQIIGKNRYCNEINKRLGRLIGFFITIWLLSSICDYGAWVIGFGWKIPILYALSYIFLLIKILTSLDLTLQVMQIQCRIRVIGDLVQDIYLSSEYYPGVTYDALKNKNWFYSKNSEDAESRCSSKLIRATTNEYKKSRLLTRSYLILTEQCSFINQMYGIRILLNNLSLFIDMVRFTNLAVRILIGNQVLVNSARIFTIASTLIRLLTCILIILSVIVHCESTYRHNDRISCLIQHLFVNKNPGPELREGMTELRDLIQSRPINFHLANFFKLEYSLLVSTASVVTTYTIILLQSVN